MKKENTCWEDECVVALKVSLAHLEERMVASEKLVCASEEKTAARLESLNEFRGLVKDQQATFLTKAEFEAKHQLIETKLDSLARFMWITIGGLAVFEAILRFIH